MTDIKWGPAIAVDGKRPGWLGDGLSLKYEHNQTGFEGLVGPVKYDDWTPGDWKCVAAIALPADHPHYRQPVSIPEGMKPWHGGQEPIDWSGEAVMFRDGDIHHAPAGAIWKLGWDHSYGSGDIVAYSVSTPQADTKPDLTARTYTADQRAAAVSALHSVRTGIGQSLSNEKAVDLIAVTLGLLPEPVDPDLIEARRMVSEQGYPADYDDVEDDSIVGIAYSCIKRGRELALAGETGK